MTTLPPPAAPLAPPNPDALATNAMITVNEVSKFF